MPLHENPIHTPVREATGDLCVGTKALAQRKVSHFLAGLVNRKDEAEGRCRTVLQSRAERLIPPPQTDSQCTAKVHPTLALV